MTAMNGCVVQQSQVIKRSFFLHSRTSSEHLKDLYIQWILCQRDTDTYGAEDLCGKWFYTCSISLFHTWIDCRHWRRSVMRHSPHVVRWGFIFQTVLSIFTANAFAVSDSVAHSHWSGSTLKNSENPEYPYEAVVGKVLMVNCSSAYHNAQSSTRCEVSTNILQTPHVWELSVVLEALIIH